MRVAIVAVSLMVLGCSEPEGLRIEGPSRELVHASSGFRFPAEQQGCDRVDPHSYDQSGEDVSVSYICEHPQLLLTIYVYPMSSGSTLLNPSDHFEAVIAAALADHSEAQVDRAAEVSLPLGTRTVHGFSALLKWSEEARQVASFVVLIPDGSRFVKVRSSFVLDDSDVPMKQAWDLTLAVLRSVGPSAPGTMPPNKMLQPSQPSVGPP